MKYMVMECHPGYAVVLDENGKFSKVGNMRYEVGQTVTDVVQIKVPKKRNIRWLYAVAAAAACLLLVLLPVFGQPRQVYASVYMTINPQVRVDVNRRDTVIGLEGLNADGETLINGYEYRNKALELVLDELVERAVDMGFLFNGGDVSIELDAADPQWVSERSEHLETRLSRYLAEKISDSISDDIAAPPAQTADPATLAEKLGIIEGVTTTGHTSANASMLWGASAYAYRDGRIYFPYRDVIYEYTVGTGITAQTEVEGNIWAPLYLSEDGERIIFSGDSGLEAINKDGSGHAVLHKALLRGGSCLDGNDFYYMEFMAESLYHTDLSTGKTTSYFTCVNTFFVTEDSIYVCARDDALDDDKFYLFRASREDMVFEKIETERQPIAVRVSGDDIFYAKSGRSWYIYHMADGVETKLPIRSWCFQIIGDSVLYVDQRQTEDHDSVLKAYNWKTGEEIILYEGSGDSFCLLADRYVCIGGTLIDLYTGETAQLLPDTEINPIPNGVG